MSAAQHFSEADYIKIVIIGIKALFFVHWNSFDLSVVCDEM